MILQFLTLLGALALFLFGMRLLSSGLQKVMGEEIRSLLPWMTSNPLKQVTTGFGITALTQSSSATTVMVVSLVNAGLLTLAQATGVIMGANIGTTITAWIISIFGFRLNVAAITYPLIAIGFVFSASKKTHKRDIGESILGFALFFLGILYMKDSLPSLATYPEVLNVIVAWSSHGFLSVLIFLFIGIFLTLIFQSSGATVALTLLLLYSGWLPFEMAAAMVLGENIGTTITANLAARVANIQARRAAFIHTLFNLFGVIWAVILFTPLLGLIGKLVTLLGFPNPTNLVFTGETLAARDGMSTLYGVSIVHTLFNLINAVILIWFTKTIVNFTKRIITPSEEELGRDKMFNLQYIGSGRFSTPSLSIRQAFKEILAFTETAQSGFDYVKKALNEVDPDRFEEYRMKLVECEELTDKYEYEIASFLNKLTMEDISAQEAQEIKVMFRIISELESLGDSCENISRILARLRAHGQEFNESSISKLNLMICKVQEAFVIMLSNLKAVKDDRLNDIENAYNAEENINTTRNVLREEGIRQIETQDSNYQANNYYLDLLAELEAMGDFMINVSQAIAGERVSF